MGSMAQARLQRAQSRLLQLTGKNENQRVSVTGAIFTRDTSNPKLGEAYRDPSGLIWGSVVKTSQGATKHMNEYDAKRYCESIGARLPTKVEFEQLARYLGQGTAEGYDPYLADGKTEILPGLADRWFWSASVVSYNRSFAWYFYGGFSHYVGYNDFYRNFHSIAVRCVDR